MTLESARHKVRALLEKRDGFEEQGMKPGLFINDAGANKVGVDIFGDVPKVGVFINNTLEEEGHGIAAVFELRSQIMVIWEKEAGKGAFNSTVEGASKEIDKIKEQPTPKPSECKHGMFQWQSPTRKICMDCGINIIQPNEKVLPESLATLGFNSQASPSQMHKPNIILPAKVITPQGSFIKGLVPMMKEIGKIKIGAKGEVKTSGKGTQYRPPVKFDHFEVVSVIRDEKGNLIPDPVMKELGDNPKELDVFLLYNDETLNFTTRYNEYKGGKCLCSGDGVVARTNNGDEKECNPDTCEVFKEKRCKPNGILSVILTKSPRLGGVYKFRTTSYNSIRSILSSLFFIKSLTGGVLAMIPLKLAVSPMTVQPKDSATAQTIYVVNVEFAGTVPQLLEKTVEVSQYQSLMRAQIQQLEATARAALCAPESEQDAKDIEAEFYVTGGGK